MDAGAKGGIQAGRGTTLEGILSEAGYDVSAAKAGIKALRETFERANHQGDLPDGAIERWADEHFHAPRAFFVQLGKTWAQK